MILASAKNKSDHSSEVEPSACPSAELGVFAATAPHVSVPEPSVFNACPSEPSVSGKTYDILEEALPALNPV